MTAVLCRHFGLPHMEIAEDIASDTFLKASEHWAVKGVPENPTAWLYTVAKNKARDYCKHTSIFETQIKNNLRFDGPQHSNVIEFNERIISDSQLAMIFAVCNPANSDENQIALALQILCGFSVGEIANAFISKTETIKKRLQRARGNLRNNDFQIKTLSKPDIRSRLETVLKTLYLLFNEGYFSKSNDQFIRKELCSEALRLNLILTENPLTNTAQTNALLALMCFQSSRIEARTNKNGEAVLFDEQDKGLWDTSLIERGNYYLANATNGKETSKYHLEAGIAYWHIIGGDDKWKKILQLYNQLVLIEYSPITALNRAFAFSKVYGHAGAIAEAEKLDLTENSQYFELMGYLYAPLNGPKAVLHYQRAVKLTKSRTEKDTLKREIKRLKDENNFRPEYQGTINRPD
ncbi:RNA polymerase sigma factor [Marinilongibacter aquaticus]|uniref:RNA polymerase sigma factor n=1 Tax=Marinilongibacter aquaticus TaxID=2975157 RepID=UPI0021BD2AB2|nr:DUF6596 domain-containing protein [Marinilongibacter aquaticus]